MPFAGYLIAGGRSPSSGRFANLCRGLNECRAFVRESNRLDKRYCRLHLVLTSVCLFVGIGCSFCKTHNYYVQS